MADFCLKCFNKINDTKYTKYDIIEDWGICEECGEHTIVVVDLRGFGLFNFFFWLFNQLSIKASMFYDDYLFFTVKKIRFRYTREQKLALEKKIPMTEELFWGCLNVCYARCDTLQLRELLHTYPQYMKKFSEDYEKELNDNPELRAKEERDWKELRASLVEDFGEEYVREHFTDY